MILVRDKIILKHMKIDSCRNGLDVKKKMSQTLRCGREHWNKFITVVCYQSLKFVNLVLKQFVNTYRHTTF